MHILPPLHISNRIIPLSDAFYCCTHLLPFPNVAQLKSNTLSHPYSHTHTHFFFSFETIQSHLGDLTYHPFLALFSHSAHVQVMIATSVVVWHVV